MDQVLATVLIALLDNRAEIDALVKRALGGESVTKDQLLAAQQKSHDLLAQLHAMVEA